jgi:hypothetical protein
MVKKKNQMSIAEKMRHFGERSRSKKKIEI